MRTKLHHQRTALRQARPSKGPHKLRRPLVAGWSQPRDWTEGDIAEDVRRRLDKFFGDDATMAPAEVA